MASSSASPPRFPGPCASSSPKFADSLLEVGKNFFLSETFEEFRRIHADNKRLQAQSKAQETTCETLAKHVTKLSKERDTLMKQVEDQKAKEASLGEVEKKLQVAEKEKTDAIKERDSLKGFRAAMTDGSVENCAEKCSTMRTYATSLITHFFDRPDAIPDISHRVDQFEKLEKLEQHYYLKDRIPLPASKCFITREMRVAALVAVFGRSLCQHVFLPCHILPPSSPSCSLSDSSRGYEIPTLEKIMAQLARRDLSQEYHVRSTLLHILPQQQEDNLSGGVDLVVKEVSEFARPFIPFPDTQQQFEEALQEVCKGIAALWFEVQRVQWKVEPSLKRFYNGTKEWEVFRLSNTEAKEASTPSPSSSSTSLAAVGAKDKGKAKVKVTTASSGGGGTSSSMKNAANGNIKSPTTNLPSDIDATSIHFALWPSFKVIQGCEPKVISKGIVILKTQADQAMKEKERVIKLQANQATMEKEGDLKMSNRDKRRCDRLANEARVHGAQSGALKSNGKGKGMEKAFLSPGGGEGLPSSAES